MDRLFFHFAWLAACLLSAAAHAAPLPGEQDLLRERQQRLLDEQQRRLEDLQHLPGQEQAPQTPQLPASPRCFVIHEVALEGATRLSPADQRRLVEPYVGQCLGVAELNGLLTTITDLDISRGLVTSRAYLPQQGLASGRLVVRIVEGRLEGLVPGQGSGLTARELAMAFPGAPGDLLNLRAVEQMVDQLNRLLSNQVKMDLVPGEHVGGSRVQVNNTPAEPWRVSLSRYPAQRQRQRQRRP
ncbi:ShlB/FhaC/HecB family hemolysin secretion/activation protein [Pseudomonas sp. C2L11]|nr:ShlB/FhaC/HecB family hemolysin secretion/activation protein [Pseudomonas typographi]